MNCEGAAELRQFRREVLILAALSVLAVAMFFVTRVAARRAHELRLESARQWHDEGEQRLRAGRPEDAVEAFRRARVNAPGNREYVLALAGALAAADRDDEAAHTLLQLRETSPEDPEVNRQLARLAAKRGEESEAVRYYRSALHGRWREAELASQRDLRLELIRYLLRQGDASSAISELLVLSSNQAERPDTLAQTARLFLAAGDERRALAQFRRALTMDPESGDALLGAGQAAFQLGDFRAARRYLRAAVEGRSGLADARLQLRISDLVLQYDPLARGLPFAERARRILAGLARLEERVACLPERPAAESFAAQVAELRPRITPRTLRDDPQLIESVVGLMSGIEEAARRECGEGEALDRALWLIGQQRTAGGS